MSEQTNNSEWSEARVIAIVRNMAETEDLPGHLVTAPINAGDTVETLGLDSLGAVYLIERLEEEAGVPLPDDFLEFTDNVAGIAKRLASLGREGA